ncbi:hypothetical protein Aph01nite_27260 [Acrocarpospora phusangensis]|uniref:DUF11 domain-containing protein n=1 Tax=Acrocarpospora phusangensis TaxID=1070424 RepID=A0A919Q903_9ACTN|nr:hypothetical protein [Acrocarpospora phusangensis]GIH24416.1 hypothetical protein Aph01nite_27260 [Acrocarpospora phusangensis]
MITILSVVLLAAPQVSVGLDNRVTEIDRTTTYVIRAVNHEATPLAANVRIAFPPGLREVRAAGAELGDSHASWMVMMPPGENTYRVTGVLEGDPGSAVAATACVYAGDLSRPVDCSTDIDQLPDPEVTPGATVLSALAMLLILSGSAGASYLVARPRRADLRV